VASERRPTYVFLRDDGVFDVPLDRVWDFVGSGTPHQQAHRHRGVRRRRLTPTSGQYSWEQPFRGATVRFTMRWTAFVPVGLAYEVLEGPFSGSKFFLSYRPEGQRTRVSVVGSFTSPDIPATSLASAVRRFFATEFEQDADAMRSFGRTAAPVKVSRPHGRGRRAGTS
jgi:hypothetical protein